ncbi:Rho-type GTPase activating protein Rga1 [Dimargaris xerosporica]|nr:Rho-type GTPase activating protein Rga1 [Dimargaris xerosporica]
MSVAPESMPRVTEKVCARCKKALPRHYVRALNNTYHLKCFTCLVCGQVVAKKFFPITSPNGETYALCEKDYYGQLDLLCHKCDEPLLTSYITANDKKYHLEHFTCSMCPIVFGPEDIYYEENGNIYCSEHYAMIAAIKCVGCQLGILKRYIEITTDNIVEPWHPECYMIYKFWHVKIAPQVYTPNSRHESITSGNLERDQIVDREPPNLSSITEDQIYSIWTILSTFEESSAACISDMLIHVSNLAYVEALLVAEKFIMHVHTLFTAIDDLEDQLAHFDDATGLQHTKEPKILCKRIICFFALLSQSNNLTNEGMGMTQDLLTLVTGLAHYLKILIRSALMGALKAEREYGSKVSLNGLLHKLTEINDRARASQFRKSYQETGVTSDLCAACRVTLEEECIAHGLWRWHKGCFKCHKCERDLKALFRTALYDTATDRVLCAECNPSDLPTSKPFVYTTQLEQYSFLLRVALKRLYSLLCLKRAEISREVLSKPVLINNPPPSNLSSTFSNDTIHTMRDPAKMPAGMVVSSPESTHKRRNSRPRSFTNGKQMTEREIATETGALGNDDADKLLLGKSNITPMRVSSRLEPARQRQVPAADHSALRRKPTIERNRNAPTAVDVVTVGDAAMSSPQCASPTPLPPASAPPSTSASPRAPVAMPPPPQPPVSNRSTMIDSRLPSQAARANALNPPLLRTQSEGAVVPPEALSPPDRTQLSQSPPVPSHHPGPAPDRTPRVSPPLSHSVGNKTLLCELNPLEHFIAKHIAVSQLIPLVQAHVTADELLDMVGPRKQSIWTRLKANMNQKKKANPKIRDSVFGAPIEELVERQGVDSKHGVTSTVIRVPAFVEVCVDALKRKNLAIEGVFRKNGNIRRLKELSDSIDQDLAAANLDSETAIQCAALMKKFLREMAEPLLTFKLHKLFLACERICDEQAQLRAFHYACTLLPVPNRDCTEVVFGLLHHVAQFAHVRTERGEGSLMDIGNLATVITPNILYSGSKDPLKDDSFAAIQAVYILLQHQSTFWTLPPDIALVLQQQDKLSDNINMLSSKDLLKRCDNAVRTMKKSHSNMELLDHRAA